MIGHQNSCSAKLPEACNRQDWNMKLCETKLWQNVLAAIVFNLEDKIHDTSVVVFRTIYKKTALSFLRDIFVLFCFHTSPFVSYRFGKCAFFIQSTIIAVFFVPSRQRSRSVNSSQSKSSFVLIETVRGWLISERSLSKACEASVWKWWLSELVRPFDRCLYFKVSKKLGKRNFK